MTKFDAFALAGRDTFTRDLGIEVIEAAQGRAVTRVRVEERHVNFNGVCHGGLTFTLMAWAHDLGTRLAARGTDG